MKSLFDSPGRFTRHRVFLYQKIYITMIYSVFPLLEHISCRKNQNIYLEYFMRLFKYDVLLWGREKRGEKNMW